MTTKSSVADVRYTLTEAGRAALAEDLGTCSCEMKIAGLLLQCPHCLTIYGYLRSIGKGAVYNGKVD